MKRTKKEMVSIKLSPQMKNIIKEYAEDNDVPFTRVIEYALIEYFQKRNKDILL